MRTLTFFVPDTFDGGKLKTFLRGPCQVSSSILTRLKWIPNSITVNGESVHVTQILSAGDTVCLHLPETESQVQPEKLPVALRYEDEDILLVNKPSHMPVYPTPGHDRDSLANGIAFEMAQRGEPFAFHPIFRLDRNTSGLLVVAKHCYSASLLSSGVEKRYYAICEGILSGSGVIDRPIRLKPGHTIQREVGEGGQRAVTHWKALRSFSDHTLLEIQLETGRTHQIRVHFSSIGHPLAGDDLYGGSLDKIGRQALHCGWVSLQHPVTKEQMEWYQPLPDDMCALLKEE